jgi:hypothetical protein
LVGLGLAGLVPSAILASQNGTITDGPCDFYGTPTPCRVDTRPALTAGFALSAASLISGIFVLTWPSRAGKEESATCRAR